MPILVLDLDLTVFFHKADARELHEAHAQDLSDPIEVEGHIIDSPHTAKMAVRLINRTLLSNMLERAVTQHQADIMFLTSGAWVEQSVKDMLQLYLDISEQTTEKIQSAKFLSTHTCRERFPDMRVKLNKLSKSVRLNKFIEHYPQFANRHFVMVDDNLDHIESFKNDKHVTAVYASTDTEEMDFYDEAIRQIEQAKECEKSRVTQENSVKSNRVADNKKPGFFLSNNHLIIAQPVPTVLPRAQALTLKRKRLEKDLVMADNEENKEQVEVKRFRGR